MRDEHIIDVLDSGPLSALSSEQLSFVKTHCQDCAPCKSAYQAATLSMAAIKGRVQSVIEPSPFFQTRVLAALRERQAEESVPAFVRLWKSAGALVSSMAVATIALAAFSFTVPTLAPSPDQTAAYSAESVLLDQSAEDQMTYEQVLSTIYADEVESK